MLLIVGFYTLLSLVMVVSKEAIKYVQPFFLSGSRMFVGGIIFLLYRTWWCRLKIMPKKKDWPLFLALMIGNFFIDGMRVFGLTMVPVSHAALIATTAPFFAALLSYCAFGETINKTKLYALVIGFCSVWFLIFSRAIYGNPGTLVGYFSLICSTAALVCVGVINRILIHLRRCDLVTVIGIGMVGGGLISCFVSLMCEQWQPVPIMNMYWGPLLMVILLCIHNLFCFPYYAYLANHFSITLISFAQFLMPIITTFFSWIFLGEMITTSFVLAVLCVIASLFVFYYEDAREGHL